MDDYSWWRQALAGERVPVHADIPQCGRFKRHGGLPCAIWRDTETNALHCVVDGEIRDAQTEWTWVAKTPVTQEAYHHRITHGKWPEETARCAQTVIITEPRKAFKYFETDPELLSRLAILCEQHYRETGRTAQGSAVKEEALT